MPTLCLWLHSLQCTTTKKVLAYRYDPAPQA